MATYGQLISLGPRFSGGRLCTLRVYHYSAGTTTLKDVYTDREKTTTDNQPAVSDSDGMVSFYADGLYKFRIDGSTDGVTYTTLDTIDKWAVVDQSLTLSGEGAAIASATTLVLGTDGDFFHVTGSTGPIGIISGSQVRVTLAFDSTPTLTHSGSLILQGELDVSVVAGDVIAFVSEGGSVWREESRLLASNPAYSGVSNPVINGQFNVWQWGTSFTSTTTPANSDDVYTADCWYTLSDGNDIVDVTQGSGSGSVPTNGLYAMLLDVETINKKFGVAQIIERVNCERFMGRAVTFSFKSKVTTTTKLDNIKAAIVAWSGTADTVTSDIVSAWGAEGTNPTLVANCTYENTPANLGVTTTYATYSVSGVIDTASATNILLFIWSDVTDTTLGEFLYITDVKLELGTSATEVQFRPWQDELNLCRRYRTKSFQYATAPAQNVGLSSGEEHFPSQVGASSGTGVQVRLYPPMRTVSSSWTLTTYNPSAANAQMRNTTDGADCSAVATVPSGDNQFLITATTSAGTIAGESLRIHWSVENNL